MKKSEFILTFKGRYSLPFLNAIYFLLEKEGAFNGRGGYVNDPKDRGGETKYGISKRAFPG